MRNYLLFFFAGFLSLGWGTPINSQETTSNGLAVQPQDQTELNRRAIEQVISSYESAFNSKNIETLVSHWSETGVYSSQTSGNTTTGPAAMRKEFEVLSWRPLDNTGRVVAVCQVAFPFVEKRLAQ